jgi:hypothetical protein
MGAEVAGPVQRANDFIEECEKEKEKRFVRAKTHQEKAEIEMWQFLIDTARKYLQDHSKSVERWKDTFLESGIKELEAKKNRVIETVPAQMSVSAMARGAGLFYHGEWSPEGKTHDYCHLNQLAEDGIWILEGPQLLCGRISYWADAIDKYVREECKKGSIKAVCKAAKDFKGRFPKHFWGTGAFFKRGFRQSKEAVAAKRVDALNKWLDTNAVGYYKEGFRLVQIKTGSNNKRKPLPRDEKNKNAYSKALKFAQAHRAGKVSSWLKDKAPKGEFTPLKDRNSFRFSSYYVAKPQKVVVTEIASDQ